MKHPHSILLWSVLSVGVFVQAAIVMQLQRAHSQHQLQFHWSSHAGTGAADWLDTSVRDQAQPESALRSAIFNRKSEKSEYGAGSGELKPQDDLRLDIGLWLEYAAADAAQEGTGVPESCQQAHGAAFLHRFRSSCGVLCGPGPSMPAHGQQQQQQVQETPLSQVECCTYPVDSGEGLACRSRNIVLNTTAFMGSPPLEGESSHAGYLPQGTPGSVQLQCRMPHLTSPTATAAARAGDSDSEAAAEAEAAAERRAVFMDRQLQRERLPWFKSALQQTEPSAIRDSCSSGDDVISHPVMFVTRLDPTNPYHHTQVRVTLCSGLLLSTMLDGFSCT
jgi:hypothetical protein